MPWSSQVKRHVHAWPTLVNAEPAAVEAAIDRLVDLALAWESPGGLRPLSGVAEGLAGGPEAGVSGLRPCSSPTPEPAEVAARLAELSEPARAMLEHVLAAGGEATTERRAGTRCCPRTPRPRPRSCCPGGCWCRAAPAPSWCPGEVGLALRGGRTTVDRVDDVPALATTSRAEQQVDGVAAGAAFEAVRRLELLLDLWGAEPPAALRSGGLGVRDLKATATALHLDEATLALLVETASAAGLLATAADPVGNPVWLPTDPVDTWVLRPPAERWAGLARTWLASPRMPGLVGLARHRGQGVERAGARAGRRAHGRDPRDDAGRPRRRWPRASAWPPGTGAPSVVALLRWQRPRRPRTRADQVAWTAGRGGRARGHRARTGWRRTPARCWPARTRRRTRRWPALLPEPVDHVLLQADLTAVAPGPLESQLARRLQLVAEVESRGGATSTGSRPARYAARSTPAGPRSSCTSSSARCRGRRCRSR